MYMYTIAQSKQLQHSEDTANSQPLNQTTIPLMQLTDQRPNLFHFFSQISASPLSLLSDTFWKFDSNVKSEHLLYTLYYLPFQKNVRIICGRVLCFS